MSSSSSTTSTASHHPNNNNSSNNNGSPTTTNGTGMEAMIGEALAHNNNNNNNDATTVSSDNNNNNNASTIAHYYSSSLITALQSTTVGLWMYKGFAEAATFRRADRLQQQPIRWWRLLGFATVRLVLQVCGAAGAVWGSSQVYGLRQEGNDGSSNDDEWSFWRTVCLYLVTPVFALRWFWHCKHYLEQDKLDYPTVKRHHRRLHRGSFCQVYSARWILQVGGAAGAVWGGTEAFGWRTEQNSNEFQVAAAVVGLLFAVRWGAQVMEYCLCCGTTGSTGSSDGQQQQQHVGWIILARWIDAIVTPLLLDVLGGAGAVWGFSEIVGWRNRATQSQWSWVARGAAGALGYRWMQQVYDFVQHERRGQQEVQRSLDRTRQQQQTPSTEQQQQQQPRPSTPKSYNTMDRVSSPDVELADLQFKEDGTDDGVPVANVATSG